MLEIRFAEKTELPLIQDFIKTHWKEDHIFTWCDELIDFQHLNNDSSRYNFVVGYDNESGKYTALLGFIPVAHFDESISKHRNDIWLAIWKVSEQPTSVPGLGLQLLKFLKRELKPDSISAIGINDDVANLYKILGYKVGTLDHFIVRNSEMSDFKVYSGTTQETEGPVNESVSLKLLTEFSDHFLEGKLFPDIPKKTPHYLKNRFQNHPFYSYNYLQIFTGSQLNCVCIMRENIVEQRRSWAIVDIFWNEEYSLPNIKGNLQHFLKESEAEYIDLVTNESKLALELGFSPVNSEKEIVPIYFEPFEQKNVTIKYATSQKSPFRIFKGDSDQDRPNLIDRR